jgi:hypothetical protein
MRGRFQDCNGERLTVTELSWAFRGFVWHKDERFAFPFDNHLIRDKFELHIVEFRTPSPTIEGPCLVFLMAMSLAWLVLPFARGET